MPIGYLDVPTGADLATKKTLVAAIYVALHEAYPFPDDHRIFIREWAPENVSQNGLLGSEPVRPVLILHVPADGDPDAQRIMIERLDAAVTAAYGLRDFAIFLNEHGLSTVAISGHVLADDLERVAQQSAIYPS